MRLPKQSESMIGNTGTSGGVSSKVIVLASIAFLLSAAMQLATAWLQTKNREMQCGGSVTTTTSTGSLSGKSGVLAGSESWEDEYTWRGNDFPNSLPLDLGEPVAMVIEDSRHYSVDLPAAKYEWHSIYPGDDLGFVRLGPNKRFFSLSLYHQIHCLDTLRTAITRSGPHHKRSPLEKRNDPHWAHCLNYLRQTIMCNADLTLEPEIDEGGNDVGEGLYVTHVCKDWSKVHAFVAKNWDDWAASPKGNATKVAPPEV